MISSSSTARSPTDKTVSTAEGEFNETLSVWESSVCISNNVHMENKHGMTSYACISAVMTEFGWRRQEIISSSSGVLCMLIICKVNPAFSRVSSVAVSFILDKPARILGTVCLHHWVEVKTWERQRDRLHNGSLHLVGHYKMLVPTESEARSRVLFFFFFYCMLQFHMYLLICIITTPSHTPVHCTHIYFCTDAQLCKSAFGNTMAVILRILSQW